MSILKSVSEWCLPGSEIQWKFYNKIILPYEKEEGYNNDEEAHFHNLTDKQITYFW